MGSSAAMLVRVGMSIAMAVQTTINQTTRREQPPVTCLSPFLWRERYHIRGHDGVPHVAFGSKPEKLNESKCFPLFTQQRTSMHGYVLFVPIESAYAFDPRSGRFFLKKPEFCVRMRSAGKHAQRFDHPPPSERTHSHMIIGALGRCCRKSLSASSCWIAL